MQESSSLCAFEALKQPAGSQPCGSERRFRSLQSTLAAFSNSCFVKSAPHVERVADYMDF